MLWILSFHIMTLAVWTAAALYVPLVLLQMVQHDRHGEVDGFASTPSAVDSVARFVFTHIATPAALLSITAGTVVFLLNQSAHFWLLVKLTLVTLLCVAQACLGLLIIRVEREKFRWLRPVCLLLVTVFCTLMLAIIWIVLAKPAEPESLPWSF